MQLTTIADHQSQPMEPTNAANMCCLVVSGVVITKFSVVRDICFFMGASVFIFAMIIHQTFYVYTSIISIAIYSRFVEKILFKTDNPASSGVINNRFESGTTLINWPTFVIKNMLVTTVLRGFLSVLFP
jgi:hypothetical protein